MKRDLFLQSSEGAQGGNEAKFKLSGQCHATLPHLH
jgi:hypothetical protein